MSALKATAANGSSARVNVAARVDGPPGAMLVCEDVNGRQVAVYVTPDVGMTVADKLHVLCEPWMLAKVDGIAA